jgi:hypothetical protein
MELQGSKFKVLTVFVVIGFLVTIGLVFLTVMFPDSLGQIHEIDDPVSIANELLANPEQRNISLYSIILDNFFILGYFSLFYGVYLLTKDLDPVIPKSAFILGIFTAVFDILENSLLLGILNGVPVGFTPEELLFGIFWFFMSVKDIFAVLTTFTFAILLLIGLNDQKSIRIHKLVLAGFLLLFTFLGSLGLMSPLFLQLRNVSFVVDLAVASVVFYSISRK